MSDVIRYSAAGTKIVETDPAGPLVEYIDYAILKAELTNCKSEADRLEAEVERLTAMADENAHLHKGIYSLSLNVVQLQDENARLRASSFVTAVPVEQYERLIKAGDAMAEAMWYGDAERSIWVKKFAETAWNAAKVGKPSV